MPIRLLPKQEISRLQAEQRRVDIEEGTKLARRVDNLREIAAKEETSLASFRSRTVAEINKEIQEATRQRDSLLTLVLSLRKEIENGTNQLNIRAVELDDLAVSLKEEELTLEKRITALKKLAIELKQQEKANKDYSDRLSYGYKVLKEIEIDTNNRYQEANTCLAEAENKAKSIIDLSEEMKKELQTRDITVASKERDLIIRAEHLDQRTESLRVKELNLIDREQTLEREFKRLKNI